MGKRKTWRWLTAVVGALLLFGGCASKRDRELFGEIRQKSPELRTLQQTEKAVFGEGEGNETIVLATYLPRESGKEGEAFILAVHPAGKLASSPFRLGGFSPRSLRRISRNELPETLRRVLPPWFTLYRARFAPASTDRFTLTILNEQGEKRSLLFSKGPKYLGLKRVFKESYGEKARK
jgi:hypothetical protein